MTENDNKSERDTNSICLPRLIGYRYSPDISISTLKRTEETDRQWQHPYGSQLMAIRFLS
jgi:hypothetical protein